MYILLSFLCIKKIPWRKKQCAFIPVFSFRDDIPDSQGAGSEGRLDPHRDEGRSQQMLSMEDDNSEHPEELVLDYRDERDSWLRVTLLSCLRCFACVCHPVK